MNCSLLPLILFPEEVIPDSFDPTSGRRPFSITLDDEKKLKLF